MTDERQVPDDGSPPGHIEKMLGARQRDQQVDESAPADEPTVAERPENIPEKFWDAEKGEVNVEALLKSQQDAEAALRQKQGDPEPDPNEGTEDTNEGNETPEDTPTQTTVVADASAEWDEKGELSEDTLKNLEGVGISRDMVQMYIDGMQAVVSKLQTAAFEPFGGAEGYESAAEWAAENLTEGEIKAIDIQLLSNNPDIVAAGAKALAKRFKEEGNFEPPSMRGSGNSGPGGAVYTHRSQMVRDMRDPRYRRDASFRKEVEERIRRSNLPRG